MFGRGTNDGIKDTTSDFKAEERERYIPSRNPMVQVLQKSKHKIHKPKKGKGSYRRIKHGMV